MRMTERDKFIVKAANDYRIISQSQLQRLFFGSKSRAQSRLWLLWQHGFLKRQFLPVLGGVQNSPILYLIDKNGVELLQVEFGYTKDDLRWSRKPTLSHRYLHHTLGLGEIRLAVETSCQNHNFTLVEWRDERRLKQGYDFVQIGRRKKAVLPDGYFKIKVGKTRMGKAQYLHFFLEYDRGPETLDFFKEKIRTYWAYFESPLCNKRYGTNSIRVLTVTEGGVSHTGLKRLKSVRGVTRDFGAHTWFNFTNLERIMNEDFLSAPIWEQTHTTENKPLITR